MSTRTVRTMLAHMAGLVLVGDMPGRKRLPPKGKTLSAREWRRRKARMRMVRESRRRNRR